MLWWGRGSGTTPRSTFSVMTRGRQRLECRKSTSRGEWHPTPAINAGRTPKSHRPEEQVRERSAEELPVAARTRPVLLELPEWGLAQAVGWERGVLCSFASVDDARGAFAFVAGARARDVAALAWAARSRSASPAPLLFAAAQRQQAPVAAQELSASSVPPATPEAPKLQQGSQPQLETSESADSSLAKASDRRVLPPSARVGGSGTPYPRLVLFRRSNLCLPLPHHRKS